MTRIAKCPNCHAEFDVADYNPGDQFQCPDCNAIVTVPKKPDSAIKKLTIGDRTRIGSGIKKKTSQQRPARPQTGGTQRRKQRPQGQRPANQQRPAAQRPAAQRPAAQRPASQRPANQQRPAAKRPASRTDYDNYDEEEDYQVKPASNYKKTILIISGLVVIVVVLVVTLWWINKDESTENINGNDNITDDDKLQKDPVEAAKKDAENPEDTEKKDDTNNNTDTTDENADENKKDETPVIPKEVIRSEDYKTLMTKFFEEVVEKKLDDGDFWDNYSARSLKDIFDELNKVIDIQYPANVKEKCPDDYFYRGLINSTKYQRDAAITDYSDCIAMLKNETKWKYHDATNYLYYKRGAEYIRKIGDTEKAIEDFNIVIEKDAEFADAYILRGKGFYRLDKFQEAYEDFVNAIKINKEYGEYKEIQQMIDKCKKEGAKPVVTDEDRREAIKELTEAIEENPENVNALSNRGNLYLALKEWKKAEDDYTKVIDILEKNNPTFHSENIKIMKRMRIICWRELGELDKALVGINGLLDKSGEDPMLLATRGLIYLKMKKYRDALSDLVYAVDKEPELGKQAQITDAIAECKAALNK